jgi:hypothetical protein
MTTEGDDRRMSGGSLQDQGWMTMQVSNLRSYGACKYNESWFIKLAAKTFRILSFVTEIYVYENKWIADFLNACNARKKRHVHEFKEACASPLNHPLIYIV